MKLYLPDNRAGGEVQRHHVEHRLLTLAINPHRARVLSRFAATMHANSSVKHALALVSAHQNFR